MFAPPRRYSIPFSSLCCVLFLNCGTEDDQAGATENPAVPSCMDGLKNGGETDVDCGGSACPNCTNGKACTATTDCSSGICTGGLCDETPSAATCVDGQKNADETDVDCGGSTCSACADGKTCAANTDCSSGTCTGGLCAEPPSAATCIDGLKNAVETDVDCGGDTCPACADGKACEANADCTSGTCTAGLCADALPAATCVDGVKNADETDVDCGGGGACAACTEGNACAANTDCVGGVCSAGTCAGTGLAVTQVAAGNDHVCALASLQVKCWGDNSSGALGLGDTSSRGTDPNDMGANLPTVDLGVYTGGKVLAAGYSSTCAILHNDAVKCWGLNDAGQLGQGDTSSRGDEPYEVGGALPPVSLGSGRSAKSIAVGFQHVCAILDNDELKCWGDNSSGALGLGTEDNRGDGPDEMGDNLPAVSLGTGRHAVQISLGASASCALLDDGTIKCWGYNGSGQLGQGDTVSRGAQPGQMGDALLPVSLGTGRTAKSVSVGTNYFACAVLDDDTVKCWGGNESGQLGRGDTDNVGDEPGEMGDALAPVALGTGRTAKSVASGHNRSVCAILDNDMLKCWGNNSDGELGLGDAANRGDNPGEMGDNLLAVSLGTGRTPTQVTVGYNITCALLDSSTVKCWGRGSNIGSGSWETLGDDPNEMGNALLPVHIWPG